MNRPLAEFLLRVIWLCMDYLEPYIEPAYLKAWENARKGLMENIQFISLPGDEQFG